MKYVASVIYKSDGFSSKIEFEDYASFNAWARLMALENVWLNPFKTVLITDGQDREIFFQKNYKIVKNLLTTRF